MTEEPKFIDDRGTHFLLIIEAPNFIKMIKAQKFILMIKHISSR
jgi:hypothetical protein